MSTFVFTGTFKVEGEHIVRDLLIASLCDQGHVVKNKVDYGTDYLVRSAQGGHGTVKEKAALRLGTVILTPQEFWTIYTDPQAGGF